MRLLKVVILATLFSVAGCSSKPSLQCTSTDATSTTIGLIKDELEKATFKSLSSDSGSAQIGHSTIRASISQLIIAIDDIRTSKEDPSSTKRFCTGSLNIRVPSQTLEDAESARSSASLSNISSLADQSDVERDADTFKISFDYDVQPTDDGTKVYSETADMPKITGFFAELLSSSLLKSTIEQNQQQQQQAASAEQEQQSAALTQQRNADMESAKTDNQLANQTIAAVWKNLAPDTRSQILANQRAWINKKVADCNVEAAGASTDPTEQQTARYKCDTRVTQERTQTLQQMPSAPTSAAASNE